MSEREGQRFGSPLESERGSTTIEDNVVSTIAGLAAREVEGIDMGGAASRTAGGVLERVTGSQILSRGISVKVGKVETAIDVTMAVEYGRNILQLAERVRNKITERVENLTGLRVVELYVTISDIIFPEEEEGSGRRGEPGSGSRYEDQPRAQRTEEFRASEGRERETAVFEPAEASTREPVRESVQGLGDQGEVRVEGLPPDREETAELRPGEIQGRPPAGEDETRRIR